LIHELRPRKSHEELGRFERPKLEEFVKSQRWGPLNVNVSNIADLDWFFDAGGIHMDDFLNW
jgi:hypothetical protein